MKLAVSRGASAGFTLLEVLIALAILAIALMAAMRAGVLATQNVGDIKLRLLADWVAQNRVEEHRARRDWQPLGTYAGDATQAGTALHWEERITGTPNAQFRRIDVRVYEAQGPDKDHALAQFTSFLVKPGG